MSARRILLGQLAANGDCLYATILARQIKHDNPESSITWAIAPHCAGLLRNNPDIDEVWEVPVPDGNKADAAWRAFEREAMRRLRLHEFDHAYLSQIWPDNFQNYDGTVRPSILRCYGAPITVPIENIIVLDDRERTRIEAFATENDLEKFEHRILFEAASKSRQSFVTPELAQSIADYIYRQLPSVCVIFSTHEPMQLRHPNSRYAGTLSLRELGGLTRHCSLFVGCGSGGTVAATSTAATMLPMIQLLSAVTSVFASFAHDFSHYGLAHRHIVEMTRESPVHIAAAIVCACAEGIESAQNRYGETIPVRFEHYAHLITTQLLRQERYLDAAQSVLLTTARYGWTPFLRQFAAKSIVPKLASDRDWMFAHRRRAGEEFMECVRQPQVEPQ